MSVRVSLAGRLEVETDGRTLDAARLPGRQGRVVLAYLVAERDRLVLLARDVEGLPYADIAARLGLPGAQVGMIVKRARGRLELLLLRSIARRPPRIGRSP